MNLLQNRLALGMTDLVPTAPGELIDPQSQRIVEFLGSIGLPSNNIIADIVQRKSIGSNLREVIAGIPEEQRSDARYLSKFVLGAAYGLFDYSLNAIWNEVVVVLRRKAVVYGLDIFFDAAVGGSKNRDFYQSEDDLPALKDIILLDTSYKLELISDTTYKKLRHMLDMRNDVGISHPNEYSVTAFELLSYLEVTVRVLNDQPTEAALQVQSFIQNLKTRTDPIDSATEGTIKSKIVELPSHLCGSLLRTMFGIYVTPETDAAVRKNVATVSRHIWKAATDQPKYRLGIVLEGYKSNLHQDKHILGEQFFENVGGNSYRSESERSVILDEAITDLYQKHNGWDNFHHEPPVARKIASFVPDQASVPLNIAEPLFKTILVCRIGNGVRYHQGVSPGARSHYDAILALGGDKFGAIILTAVRDMARAGSFRSEVPRGQVESTLIEAKKNAINARLIECYDFLIEKLPTDEEAPLSREFAQLFRV